MRRVTSASASVVDSVRNDWLKRGSRTETEAAKKRAPQRPFFQASVWLSHRFRIYGGICLPDHRYRRFFACRYKTDGILSTLQYATRHPLSSGSKKCSRSCRSHSYRCTRDGYRPSWRNLWQTHRIRPAPEKLGRVVYCPQEVLASQRLAVASRGQTLSCFSSKFHYFI